MIPQTTAALLSFAVLIMPGVMFEWLRRGARPSVDRTPFDEVAVVAFTSTAFSLAAFGVLALVAVPAPFWFPDLEAWAQTPDSYAAGHLLLIVRTISALAIVACTLAVLVNRVMCTRLVDEWIRKRRGRLLAARLRMSPNSADYEVLVDRRPSGSQTYVSITLADDDRQVAGWLAAMDEEGDGSIVLTSPLLVRRGGGDEEELTNFSYVLVPKTSLTSITARYELVQ